MTGVQELVGGTDPQILELFAEHGAPPGTEQVWVSADGTKAFAFGDYDEFDVWNRIAELYQPAYAGAAQFFPVVGADVATANVFAGHAAGS